MTAPDLSYLGPPEPPAPYTPSTHCDPTPKPGVVAFADWLLRRGGTDLGVGRKCAPGKSAHYEGRAWDWGLDAADPAQRRIADEAIAELFAEGPGGTPQELLRRAGVAVVIWNRRIATATNPVWRPYTGPSPHTSHVHFAFGWPGAMGQTSFYRWLRGQPPPRPTRLARAKVASALPALAGFVVVAAGSWLAFGRRP